MLYLSQQHKTDRLALGKQEILSLVLFAYHVDSWRWLRIHYHTQKYDDYPNLDQLKKKKSVKKRPLNSPDGSHFYCNNWYLVCIN